MAFEIILVEDSDDDAVMLRRAFHRSDAQFNIRVFTKGNEALQYLVANASERETPDLLVLDLQLPDVTGNRLLGQIRETAPHLRNVPVAVVSNHMPLKAQLHLHAIEGCFDKPFRYEGWKRLASALENLASRGKP